MPLVKEPYYGIRHDKKKGRRQPKFTRKPLPNTTIFKCWADFVHEFRRRMNMTQLEMAEYLEVTFPTYMKWEADENTRPYTTVRNRVYGLWCRRFGIAPEEEDK